MPESYPATLRILHYPNPILRQPARTVETFDEGLAELARRMLVLMHELQGVGLAAPQVGVSIRLFVCNPTGEPRDDLVAVNPVLTDLSGAEEKPEGCLSIPGVTVQMRRAFRACLRAQDARGAALELSGEDLRARVWQHETDHLNGVLIIDRMSEADEIANRRALKALRGA